MNSDGPFFILRYAPRDIAERLKLDLINLLFEIAMMDANAIYIVVDNRVELMERREAIERRSGLRLDHKDLHTRFHTYQVGAECAART